MCHAGSEWLESGAMSHELCCARVTYSIWICNYKCVILFLLGESSDNTTVQWSCVGRNSINFMTPFQLYVSLSTIDINCRLLTRRERTLIALQSLYLNDLQADDHRLPLKRTRSNKYWISPSEGHAGHWMDALLIYNRQSCYGHLDKHTKPNGLRRQHDTRYTRHQAIVNCSLFYIYCVTKSPITVVCRPHN